MILIALLFIGLIGYGAPSHAANAQADLPSSDHWEIKLNAGDGADFFIAPVQPQPEHMAHSKTFVVRASATNSFSDQQVALQYETQTPGFLPWCQESALTLSSLISAECLSQGTAIVQPAIQNKEASLNWLTPNYSLAVTQSSAERTSQTLASSSWAIQSTKIPNGELTLIPLYGQSRALTVGGIWNLGAWGDLSIAAGNASTQWQTARMGKAIDIEQSALSLGLRRGTLYGSVTGRVIEPTSLQAQRWGGLDLGLSWQTPWKAQLSFGAQNLLNKGKHKDTSDASRIIIEETSGRTPYVRYTQDW
jgi:hypothetical protein